MDDKWTVFEESGTLCICRSWTGICIYKVVLGEGDVHDVYAAPNFTQGEFELIFEILLKRMGPMPIPLNLIPHGVKGNISPVMPDSSMVSGLNVEHEFAIWDPKSEGFLGKLFTPGDHRRGRPPL